MDQQPVHQSLNISSGVSEMPDKKRQNVTVEKEKFWMLIETVILWWCNQSWNISGKLRVWMAKIDTAG